MQDVQDSKSISTARCMPSDTIGLHSLVLAVLDTPQTLGCFIGGETTQRRQQTSRVTVPSSAVNMVLPTEKTSFIVRTALVRMA